MKTGFIVCSRLGSSRFPRKAFHKVNGVPIIVHLCKRLALTGLPVYVAVPGDEQPEYASMLDHLFPRVIVTGGCGDNPLKRMQQTAEMFDLTQVIRVTHDKIFIDPDMVHDALTKFKIDGADYLCGSFMPGTKFEVFKRELLDRAQKFGKVEHITYALRALDGITTTTFTPPKEKTSHLFRFLLDYPDDAKLMEIILHSCGNDCTLREAVEYAGQNTYLHRINELPLITIYTCAYNLQKWISECMNSVADLGWFKSAAEYVIVDDFSTDETPNKIASFGTWHKDNVRWFRNSENLGLASSSNIALKHAKGKYIMRLDADDYFTSMDMISNMTEAISKSGCDVMYPDNYFGSTDRVQKGNECHHIGGALFKTEAVQHIKFTDGLRGYEGLDFFERARDQLKVGYYEHPTFFYRQHDRSLSKMNLEERAKIKARIENRK